MIEKSIVLVQKLYIKLIACNFINLNYILTNECIHSLVAYLVSFTSFYIQLPGLIGTDGILPADVILLLKYKDYLNLFK